MEEGHTQMSGGRNTGLRLVSII